MCPTPAPDPLQCWRCEARAKYKCPRCEVRSCSLACVRTHKQEADCDGLRDKTKYLPIQKFTDMDVVSDLRLLEEVTTQVDKCKRDKLKRSTRQGTDVMVAPRLHKHLQRLQSQARLRRCTLRILPPHFTRRKENTSSYDFKTKEIKWHIVLKFINIDKKISLPAVSESTKMWQLLSDFVEFKGADDPSDPFQIYRSLSYGGLSLYLKVEARDKSGALRHFYPLDMKRSIRTNLRDTLIVEHPVIYVTYKSDEHLFRDDADCIIQRENVSENPSPADSTAEKKTDSVGDVMSETDAMAADPEAYKQYFDFYLKYYTQKYAQHGVTSEPPPGLPPPPPASAPDMSRPPPPLNRNTFPSRVLNPVQPSPANVASNTYHTPPRQHTLSKPDSNNSRNFFFGENNSSRGQVVNQKNYSEAKLIQEDLKKDKPAATSSLSSLVEYDMSDSDCEN